VSGGLSFSTKGSSAFWRSRERRRTKISARENEQAQQQKQNPNLKRTNPNRFKLSQNLSNKTSWYFDERAYPEQDAGRLVLFVTVRVFQVLQCLR
jgi:hypothetical protein